MIRPSLAVFAPYIVFLCIIHSVHASCTPTVAGYAFDFSALAEHNPWKLPSVPTRIASDFYIGVCDALDTSNPALPSSCATTPKAGPGGAAFQYTKIIPSTCFTAGVASTAQWSAVDSSNIKSGIKLSYTGGYIESSSGLPRTTTITFICDPNANPLSGPVYVPSVEPNYQFSWTTSAACSTGGGGLSGGSIFLIITFSLLSFYIGVGYYWNMKRNGMPFADSFPNREGWRTFFGYVTDGWFFVLQKVRGAGGSYTSVK